MQIKTSLIRGEFHETFCEDFLYHDSLSHDLYLAAVMDGCSMGSDSHFASTLISKILKKILREMNYMSFSGDLPELESWPLPDMGKYVLNQVWKDLKQMANLLHLEDLELLSTLTLALVNTEKQEVWLILVGDGYFVAKGNIYEVDQGNRPDYMTYHLSKPFEEWFAAQKNVHHLTDIRKLILATDGVGNFEKLDKGKNFFGETPESFLLVNPRFEDKYKPTETKIAMLKKQFGLIAMDDIAIIRMSW